jgi:mRNA interferase YafQ
MLDIYYQKHFKKDYAKAIKRGCNPQTFQTVLDLLARQQPLPPKYRDHALTGNYRGYRECHIQPDWLLIYKIEGQKLLLTLARTGTHSDLF